LTFVKWIQINLKVNPGGLPLVVETETIDAPNSSGAIFSLSPPFVSFSPDLLMNWQLDARGGSGSTCTPQSVSDHRFFLTHKWLGNKGCSDRYFTSLVVESPKLGCRSKTVLN